MCSLINTTNCGCVCQEQNNEEVYHGATDDHNALLQWANEKCVPLVRELTFENAEVMFEFLLIVFLIFCTIILNLFSGVMLSFGDSSKIMSVMLQREGVTHRITRQWGGEVDHCVCHACHLYSAC